MLSRKVLLIGLFLAALAAVMVVPPVLAVTTCTAGTHHVNGNVRVRAGASTSASILTSLHAGDTVQATGTSRTGTLFAGSTLWCQVTISDGRTGYTHSSLLIAGAGTGGSAAGGGAAPTATATPVGDTTGGDTTGTTGQQNIVQPTNQSPAPQPTQAPPANTGGFQCNGRDDLNCGSFSGHAAAQAYFNMCGNEDRLDGDGDGLACE